LKKANHRRSERRTSDFGIFHMAANPQAISIRRFVIPANRTDSAALNIPRETLG
jgi:hypothetical protein